MALGLAVVPRLRGSSRSPVECLVRDGALFRSVAELALRRRPIVADRSSVWALSQCPDQRHVRFRTPVLESCAGAVDGGYEVLPGWKEKQVTVRLLGYRGVRFWGIVAAHYRERRKGFSCSCDVTESALLALVSWNPLNGDVVSKTLLLRGKEAYCCCDPPRGRPATWNWPLVAFLASVRRELVAYVASAETGEVLARWKCWNTVVDLLLCDVTTDGKNGTPSVSKKCLCTIGRDSLECRPLDTLDQVLRSVSWDMDLFFVHPQALVFRQSDRTIVYDPRNDKQLAQCVRSPWDELPDVDYGMSRLWSLSDLVHLVENDLNPRLVAFESGGLLERCRDNSVFFAPNGPQRSHPDGLNFAKDGFAVF